MDAGFGRLGHRHEDGGRGHLLDGARRIGPAGVDDRKQLRIIQRAGECGRPSVETTMIGPCWDIWNSDRRGGISAQA